MKLASKYIKLFFNFNYFLPILACAQIGTNTTQGAASLGMGNASVAAADAYSYWANPAALTHATTRSMGFAAENRLSATPLSILALGMIVPSASGNFGLSMQHFGFDNYREQQFSAAFGKKIFPNMSIGVSFLGNLLQISGYGSAAWAGFGLGFQADLIQNLRIGVHLESPFIAQLTEITTLPSVGRLGFAYQIANKTVILTEFEKRLLTPTRVKIGMTYNALQNIIFRIGLTTNPSQISIGCTMKISKIWTADIAGASHAWLGLNSGLSMKYDF